MMTGLKQYRILRFQMHAQISAAQDWFVEPSTFTQLAIFFLVV